MLFHFYLQVSWKWPSKNYFNLCVGSRWRPNTFVLSTSSADIFLKIHYLSNVGACGSQKYRKHQRTLNFTVFFTYSDYVWPWCVFALFTCCSPSVKVTDWDPVCWPVIHPDKLPACWKPVVIRGFLQITSVWVSLCFQQHFSFALKLTDLIKRNKSPHFWDVFIKWFKDWKQ